MTDVREIQKFEVSLKAFIVDGDRALFVRESDTGYWELPGGRIDVGEEWLPHGAILEREIAEELGPAFKIEPLPGAVTWTRQRPTDGAYLLLVGRLCRLLGGNPVLSPEHVQIAWLDQRAATELAFPPQSGYRDAIPQLWRLACL